MTVDDYGDRCREILPRAFFDILFGSHGDPHFQTLTNNLDGFTRLGCDRVCSPALASATWRRLYWASASSFR